LYSQCRKTQALTATVSPSNATNKAVTWTSSDTNVATVNSSSGVVTGVANGTATITVKTTDGGYTSSCAVTVTTPVSSIAGSPVEATIVTGKTQALTATVSPPAASNKNITWKSSNTDVATVNSSGVVTGVANGTANITATTVDGGYTYTCAVIIITPLLGIDVTPTITVANVGVTSILTPIFNPSTASNKYLSWVSSDTSVVTVDADGKITGVKPGTATVTAKSQEGDYTAVCSIVVQNVEVVNVAIAPSTSSVNIGASTKLTASVAPVNATVQTIAWSSSDTSIAQVDSSGYVTGIKAGTVIITATANNGVSASCLVTVNNPQILTVSPVIAVNTTLPLFTYISPTTPAQTLTWSSGNTSVATVDSKGVVKGVSAGQAIITAKNSNGNLIATCTITVVVPVSGVSLTSSLKININSTYNMVASILPSNATNKNVKWSSSNTAVATISASGVITAKSAGQTTITVTTEDGNKTATCIVTVVIPVQSVSLLSTAAVYVAGSTVKLTPTVNPSNATNKAVTWSSNNTAVATVDSSGTVKGIKAGTAIITVKTADGAKTAVCSVTVKAASTLTLSGGMSIPNPLSAGNSAVSVAGTISSNYNITNVTAQIRAGTTVKYSSVATPNATSYNMNKMDSALKFSQLAAGSYTFVVTATDASGTTKTLRNVSFTVQAASTLAISGAMTIPNPLTVGNSAVSVKGTISSNYNITNVTAQIKSGSTVKYSATAAPNAKSYNMNAMDSKLLFSKLGVGDYTFVVTAKDASGMTKTLRNVSFSVKTNVTITMSGSMTVPGTLTQGTSVSVKGTVSSNYNLTNVTGRIVNSAGASVYSYGVNPGAKSYNMANMDSKLLFSKLGAGNNYRYIVSATANGTTKTLVDVKFNVAAKAAASTLSISSSMTIPATLTVGSSGISVKGTVNSNYNLTNVTATIKTSGGTVKYTASATPNAKSYNTANMDSKLLFSKLTAGDYVYTVTAKDSSGASKTLRTTSFKVQAKAAAAASTLSISSSMTIPATLTVGSSGVSVKGTVNSNYNITNVTATIKTSGGTVKYTASATPNAKSYNTANMDSKLSFSKLTAGDYVYTVTAKDSSGASKTLRTTNFKVQAKAAAAAASTLSISSSMTIPATLTVGSSGVSVKGTVNSNYNITNVTATIKTSGGTVKYTATATPNAKSYNTANMDSKLLFSKLTAGDYVYTVTAKDSSGASKTLRTTNFKVQAKASTPAGTTPVTSGTGFTWPVPTLHSVNSYWGYRYVPAEGLNSFHKGIDIPCAKNTSVVAADGGIVKHFTQTGIGGGNYIVVTQPNGYRTVYMHLETPIAADGSTVKKGQEIAKSGNSGTVSARDGTGRQYHLHFEVRRNSNRDSTINPIKEYHRTDKRYNATNPNPVFVLQNGKYIFNSSFNYNYSDAYYTGVGSKANWAK